MHVKEQASIDEQLAYVYYIMDGDFKCTAQTSDINMNLWAKFRSSCCGQREGRQNGLQ